MGPLFALIIVLALLVQYAAWMIWRNLMIWSPVVARLTGSDYREAEQNFDSTFDLSATNIGSNNVGLDFERMTECCFRYEDHNGKTHMVELTRITRRAHSPEACMVLWYDPQNPEKCTRWSPGIWLIVLLASSGVLAWLLLGGMQVLAALSLPAR